MLSTVYSLYNSVKLDFFHFLFWPVLQNDRRNETNHVLPVLHKSWVPAVSILERHLPFLEVTFLQRVSFFFFFLFFGFFRTFLFGERESSLPPNIKDEMRWAVPQMRDVFICSLSFCDYLRFHVLIHSFIHLLVHAHAAVIPSTSVHLYHIA